jgi:hypothetical protein
MPRGATLFIQAVVSGHIPLSFQTSYRPTAAADSTSFSYITRLETVYQCDTSCVNHHTEADGHENDVAGLCEA